MEVQRLHRDEGRGVRAGGADDRCGAALAKAYGAPAANLYRDAVLRLDDRPIDFNVFDSSETGDYIRRRMAVHGFRREDFL